MMATTEEQTDTTAATASEWRWAPDPAALRRQYRTAAAERGRWEAHWHECYSFALPQHAPSLTARGDTGGRQHDDLYDGTAADAADQLAASLMAQLTPPGRDWFGLSGGTDLAPEERDYLAPLLEQAAAVLRGHFERANFAVELHQAFLDLVVAGTACLLVEEAAPGGPSALSFRAVPMSEAVLAESADGRLDITYRRTSYSLTALRRRYPAAALPERVVETGTAEPERRFAVIEAVMPTDAMPWQRAPVEPAAAGPAGEGNYAYAAFLDGGEVSGEPVLLAEGRFRRSPFINFRWSKAPGEAYGRSPVMKALPDIKTANKTVELILKNASIATTGIWQAEDDGIINPANITLAPGAIIPKAVGSQGLKPLEAPGRFDVSQMVLEDLRARIRHAMLVDRFADLAPGRSMTATEVNQRAAEVTRILGATYGRLQSELLAPLVERAAAVLQARGELPPLRIDGRQVALHYRSPLAKAQGQQEVTAALAWLETIAALGPEALAPVDLPGVTRWLARNLGVPDELVRQDAGAGDADGAGATAPDVDADALHRSVSNLMGGEHER